MHHLKGSCGINSYFSNAKNLFQAIHCSSSCESMTTMRITHDKVEFIIKQRTNTKWCTSSTKDTSQRIPKIKKTWPDLHNQKQTP